MNRIISQIPIVPMRREPSHRSEMVSQLLFGERAKVLKFKGDWLQIRTEFDNYTGWVELKSVEDFEPLDKELDWIVNPFPLIKIRKEGRIMHIPAGAEIPNPDYNGYFEINGNNYQIEQANLKKSDDLISLALKFENSPYLWGGRSLLGIDCSGFVQILYKISGIKIPRDAKDQCESGTQIKAVDETRPGDFLFFSNNAGQIVHVGMLIEPGKIIHASGSVRIDRIDNKGIYNEKLQKYTHTLQIIKRIR
jgi:gamma-D-glutamyl-L-lysine dipeptidyl-peptidase